MAVYSNPVALEAEALIRACMCRWGRQTLEQMAHGGAQGPNQGLWEDEQVVGEEQSRHLL